MHQLVNGMCPRIQEETIHTGKAEQTDGEVLSQKLVQPDDAEVLHHTDLVLRQVAEEHRGIACADVGNIVIEDVVLSEKRRRRSVFRTLLPDVAARRVLDLHQRPEVYCG